MKYRKYTCEQLEAAVSGSRSMSDVLRKLGLRLAGGTHSHIKRRIATYGINTSHFLGSRATGGIWHRGGPAKKTPQELLIERSDHESRVNVIKIRRALLEMGREHRCTECGLGPQWAGKPLVLHVDHIDGRHQNYRSENLRFLCPNCHSQTVNFGTRNLRRAEVA